MNLDLSPPLLRFLADLAETRVWGQVVIHRTTEGFELRQVEDLPLPRDSLTRRTTEELRLLADRAPDGSFRAHKSAPDLARGWWCPIADPAELGVALDDLYPGALADWFHTVEGTALPTDLSRVAARQLGSGRILQHLEPGAARSLIRWGCSPNACLRHRRWAAPGTPPEAEESSSHRIPCLEPCPWWLKLARTCARIEETATVPAELSPDDLATVAAALRWVLDHPPEGLGAGDLGSPLHPWRVGRLLERRASLWPQAPDAQSENQSHADP